MKGNCACIDLKTPTEKEGNNDSAKTQAKYLE